MKGYLPQTCFRPWGTALAEASRPRGKRSQRCDLNPKEAMTHSLSLRQYGFRFTYALWSKFLSYKGSQSRIEEATIEWVEDTCECLHPKIPHQHRRIGNESKKIDKMEGTDASPCFEAVFHDRKCKYRRREEDTEQRSHHIIMIAVAELLKVISKGP